MYYTNLQAQEETLYICLESDKKTPCNFLMTTEHSSIYNLVRLGNMNLVQLKGCINIYSLGD